MKKIFLVLLVMGLAIAWTINFLNPGITEETTLMRLKEKYPEKISAARIIQSSQFFRKNFPLPKKQQKPAFRVITGDILK